MSISSRVCQPGTSVILDELVCVQPLVVRHDELKELYY